MNNAIESTKESPVKGRSVRWVPAIYGLLVAGYLLSSSEEFHTLFQRLFMEASFKGMLSTLETVFN